MKKIIIAILCVVSLLCGCSAKQDPANTAGDDVKKPEISSYGTDVQNRETAVQIVSHAEIREKLAVMTDEELKSKDVIISTIDGVENWDRWREFLDQVNSGASSSVIIVMHTIEGDPVVEYFEYDSEKDEYYLAIDSTRDRYRGEEFSEFTGKYMSIIDSAIGNDSGEWNTGAERQWFVVIGPKQYSTVQEYISDSEKDGNSAITALTYMSVEG